MRTAVAWPGAGNERNASGQVRQREAEQNKCNANTAAAAELFLAALTDFIFGWLFDFDDGLITRKDARACDGSMREIPSVKS